MALGALRPGDRVQLIEGEIVETAPQGPRHFTAVSLVEQALRRVFDKNHVVRVQGPLALGALSEPEPDVAVVTGDARTYRDHHPVTAVLVVEVADDTLAFDRTRKAALYASAGIPEYWIVNLPDRTLEVHRDPTPDNGGRPAYRDVLRLGPVEQVSPLARPDRSLAVGELLP
jgi:Uma2 family endonuclease